VITCRTEDRLIESRRPTHRLLRRSRIDGKQVRPWLAKPSVVAAAIRQTVRRWRLHCRHTVSLADLAQEINPVLQGWLNYYGRFYRSALHAVFDTLDQYLVRWVRRKYQRLKLKVTRARALVVKIRHQRPGLFAHWALAPDGGQ